MEEREIDLKQVIWKVMLSWRAMILWGIICAAALAGFMYYKADRSYEKTKQDIENAEKLGSTLDEDELSSAKTVVNYLDQLDELRDFRDNAPIMQIDAYNAKSINYQFYVKTENDDSTIYEANNGSIKIDNAAKTIATSYSEYVVGDEFLGLLADALSADITPGEFRDLVKVESDGGVIKLSIFLTDDMDEATVSDNVVALLSAKAGDYKAVSEFTLELVSKELKTERNQELIDKKSSVNSQVVSIENQIASLKTKLNDDQLYYIDNVRPKTELVKPAVSVKFIVIGFILGVFIVCAVVFVKGAMSSRLCLAEELESLFSLNILGVVVSPDGRKRFLQFIDNALLKLKNRRVKQLSDEKRMEFATTSIAIKCEQLGTKKLSITGTDIEKVDTKLIEELTANLAKEGITVDIIDNIYYDGKALKQCVECGYVLFIEKVGTSIYNEINNQVNKAKEYDLNIIGAIAIN